MFATLIAREGYGTFLRLRVEASVTDEVEDMPGTVPHGSLQITPSLPFEPGKLHQPSCLQVPHSLLYEPLFVPHVELGQPLGTRYHAEDHQVRRHRQPFDRVRHVRVAYQRRPGRET